MLLRFVGAYPFTALIAAAIYAGTTVISTRTLATLLPPGWLGWYVASWAASLPRTVLLAPVWTALLRFVIRGEERRTYFTLDFRMLRVLRVTLVLWAILFAGGILPVVGMDVLPQFARGRLALAALAVTLLPKAASWWLVLRLALAPALAAAGTRTYPLDTSLSFTRGWFAFLLGVRATILLTYLLPLVALAITYGTDIRVLARVEAGPLWITAMVAVMAVVELADAGAMAVATQAIVKARAPTGSGPANAR
jgi:hypothetical protein